MGDMQRHQGSARVKSSPDSQFGTARDHLRRPSDEALNTLERIQQYEMRSRFLPIRRSFIERASPSDPLPPLSRLLPRAGLDAVQLKTFLLVLRMAAFSDPYESPYEANVFAKAIDLDDKQPGGTGDRRVRDAVRRLESHKLLRSVRSSDEGPREKLVPLREDGSGVRYSNPAGRRFPKREPAEGNFVAVQDPFFTQGWICALSGAAITTLLVLLTSADIRARDEPWVFVAPSQRADRYGISQDTYLNGLAELAQHKVVVRRDRKTYVGPGPFDFSRQENVLVRPERLERKPERAYYSR